MKEKYDKPGVGWVKTQIPCPNCNHAWTWYNPPYLTDGEQKCPDCGIHVNDWGDWYDFDGKIIFEVNPPKGKRMFVG